MFNFSHLRVSIHAVVPFQDAFWADLSAIPWLLRLPQTSPYTGQSHQAPLSAFEALEALHLLGQEVQRASASAKAKQGRAGFL